MEKKIVDARGLACPLPVVNAKKAVGEFKEDGVLTVLVDNEIAVQNLKKFAVQRGLEAAGEKKAEKEYEVMIKVAGRAVGAAVGTKRTASENGKTGQAAVEAGQTAEAAGQNADGGAGQEAAEAAGQKAAGEPAPEISCSPDSREKGMAVVLSANVMGGGDEKLGRALMKAFIFALTKQDVLPETILCYNSGAYLTCEGSESLEDFKELEAEGVTIMTCGTCLDFYGIKDQVAVGTVTNMYDIVETMEKAGKIIRP